MVKAAKSSKSMFFEGLVILLIGIAAIILPQLFTSGMEFAIGIILGIAGLVQVIRAFKGQGFSGVVFPLIAGLVALAAGVWLLAYPGAGSATLTIVLAIFFFVRGIITLISAMAWRHTRVWGWFLFSGIVGIALGTIIWMGYPENSSWVLGLFLGIDLIFYGWARILLSFQARH